MTKSFFAAAGLAALMSSPVLAATGPVGDTDFQCFATMAIGSTAINKAAEDPAITADKRKELADTADMLRTRANWYLARISTLSPDKRTPAQFENARKQVSAMDKDAFGNFFDSCVKGGIEDREATINQLLG